MKKILFVAGYVVSLCWRILKCIAETAWEIFGEGFLELLSVLIIGLLEDYEEYKAKKNATVEDTSDGIKELTEFDFYMRINNKRDTSIPITNETFAAMRAQACCDYLKYLQRKPKDF